MDSDGDEIPESQPVVKRRRLANSQKASQNRSITTLSSRNLQTMDAKIGRISRMQLVNFMCHANFVVEFNDKINIFVGSNGSGKSAIITALVIGLGGNAAMAERSANLAQLIRRGENSASIEITLLNHGTDSYDNEKFGDKIIIQRQINASGTSQYRIKGENGHILSRSVKDLERMLMYMNIHVGNPVCVLNQDAARSFLKEADDKKRYSLFLKASQIETVLQILQDAANLYKRTKSHFIVMEKILAKHKKDYMESKDHYERLLSVESLKADLKNLKVELEWNKVFDEEKKVEEIAKQLKEVENNIVEFKRILENRSDEIKSLTDEKDHILAELIETKTTFKNKKAMHDSLRNSYTERRSQMSHQERKYKTMLAKIKRLETDMKEIQKSIDERQTCNIVEKLKRDNEEKIQRLLEKREENKIIEGNLKQDVEMLNSNLQQITTILEDIRDKRRDAKEKSDQIRGQIKQIDVKSSNNLTIYGNHIPSLMDLLEKQHKRGMFSEMPRGPIGQYVGVKNSKWTRLIEHILGGHLRAFAFNTIEDSKKFDKLVQRDFPNIPKVFKIVTKFCFTPHNVSNGKVHAPRGTSLLLDEITVSDPVVLNVLIDQIQIETILICSGSAEANNYTAQVSNVPRNLSKIISLEPSAEYYPAPNFRSYGINLRQNRLLQTDMKQYKQQLETEFAELTNELQVYERDWAKNQGDVPKLQTMLKDKNQNLMKIENSLRRLQNEIMEIKNFEYPAQHEVDVLMNELNELQSSYDTINSGIEQEKQNYETLEQQIQTIESDIQQNRLEENKLEKLINENLQKINRITEKIDDLKQNNTVRDLKKYEADKKKIETLQRTQESVFESVKEKAESKGPMINQNRSAEKIQNLIQNYEHKIQKRCASTDDINVIQNVMIEREKSYKNTAEIISKADEMLKHLESSRINRFHWLQKYKQGISLIVRNVFLRILKIRNFQGDININNAEQKLEINIVPQDKDIPDAVSNTKSLSGGERSFSTLAFLMSLWSCVSQPFYLLDEYDVFTDEVNRNIMAKLLIREAERRHERQFCFFTPQDMSFVEESEHITFHRLSNHLESINE